MGKRWNYDVWYNESNQTTFFKTWIRSSSQNKINDIINEKNIIQYNAIDASVTIKRKEKEKSVLLFQKNDRKNIWILNVL